MAMSACCESAKGSTDVAGRWARPIGGLWHGYRRLVHWNQLRHERRQLAELSDDLLRDIGLTRREAVREARRPFWDDTGWR